MKTLDSAMVPDLDIMAEATNYNNWLFSHFQPYIGKSIIEIGSGIGNYVPRLLELGDRIVCMEPLPGAAESLRERYGHHSKLEITERGVNDDAWVQEHKESFDSAVCMNVLEHIEEDGAACKATYELLRTGGYLNIAVPAMPILYGSIDDSVGHYRRYTKSRLRRPLEEANFKVEQLYYMNIVGAPAWFFTNRILRQKSQLSGQVGVFDKLVVPIMSRVEAVIRPPIGMSLIAVARK